MNKMKAVSASIPCSPGRARDGRKNRGDQHAIHQSATFRHVGVGTSTGFDYSRTSNPTRKVLENLLAKLEGGDGGFAFSSGLAALTAVAFLFRPGDEVLVSDDLYGGTYRLFEKVFGPLGIAARYVDTSVPAEVKAAIAQKPRLSSSRRRPTRS